MFILSGNRRFFSAFLSGTVFFVFLGLFSDISLGFEEKTAAVPPSRQGKELQAAVKETMKRWNKAQPAQAEEAAKEFLVLHGELQADTRIPPAERAKTLKNVRLKLAALSRQISKNLEKEAGQQKTADTGTPEVETVRLPEGKSEIAAQLGGGRQQQWNAGGVNNNATNRAKTYGEDLVNVIQTTIHPDSWEERGGPGTIKYWNLQHYLIITQTDEVHEQIGGLMHQLRR